MSRSVTHTRIEHFWSTMLTRIDRHHARVTAIVRAEQPIINAIRVVVEYVHLDSLRHIQNPLHHPAVNSDLDCLHPASPPYFQSWHSE